MVPHSFCIIPDASRGLLPQSFGRVGKRDRKAHILRGGKNKRENALRVEIIHRRFPDQTTGEREHVACKDLTKDSARRVRGPNKERVREQT